LLKNNININNELQENQNETINKYLVKNKVDIIPYDDIFNYEYCDCLEMIKGGNYIEKYTNDKIETEEEFKYTFNVKGHKHPVNMYKNIITIYKRKKKTIIIYKPYKTNKNLIINKIETSLKYLDYNERKKEFNNVLKELINKYNNKKYIPKLHKINKNLVNFESCLIED